MDTTTATTAETQLLTDVEALRARHPNTQDLYREVCTVMFFRYGITPTANRLYQLVRKGSMSAPAEALNRFWSQLRERSRVTIDGPDLPEGLRKGAGELLTALWKEAQQDAAAGYAALRDEAAAQVDEARAAAAQAQARSEALTAELAAAQAALAEARGEAAELRRQVQAGEALQATLRTRIDDARKEMNEQHAWFKTVERDHAAALDKLRGQLQAAERETAMQRELAAARAQAAAALEAALRHAPDAPAVPAKARARPRKQD